MILEDLNQVGVYGINQDLDQLIKVVIPQKGIYV
jgi:hypothetical protein